MKIAIATSAGVPIEYEDDARLTSALTARGVDVKRAIWDDPAIRWDDFDLIAVRSTWDYPRKHAAFLEWIAARGQTIRNSAEIIRWNSDKHYVADLAAAGLPVVSTLYVEPGSAVPPLRGEVVVKPTISAGARHSGRFSPSTHEDALALVNRLHQAGKTAMIQPYIPSVDIAGETALIFLGGHFTHAVRKNPVLQPDEIAPIRDDAIGAAEAMYDPNLVRAATATEAERAVATRVIDYLSTRFGVTPVHARVDLISDSDGEPVLLELEAIEPNLYLNLAPEEAGALADALLDELKGTLPHRELRLSS